MFPSWLRVLRLVAICALLKSTWFFRQNGNSCFNMAVSFQTDFIAIEIMNGHVYVHMDLGSGSVKVRASRRRVDDGDWHELTLRRTGNNGRVTVDGSPAEFVTPGN